MTSGQFNCGQTELAGCESVTFTLLPGEEIVYTFGGDPSVNSWSSDLFVEIADGAGQCIYFAGFNNCNLTSECYYAGELGAQSSEPGIFEFNAVDLLDQGMPWTFTVHNAYGNSSAVSYHLSTACTTCDDPLNCIEVCPGEDSNQWYLPVVPEATGSPAVLACSTPNNYTLADNQACAEAVVASDEYCSGNSWDTICQAAYDTCPGCTNPVACNYDADASIDDGSCLEDLDGNGICDVDDVDGCTNPNDCNYNPDATSEGSFLIEVIGCDQNESFLGNYVMVDRGHFEQNFSRFVDRETILSVDGIDYLYHQHTLSNCDEIFLYISPLLAPGGISFDMNNQALSPGDLIEVRNTPCQSLSFCTECDDAYVAHSVALSTTMLPDVPEANAWTENYIYTSLKNYSNNVSYLLTGDEIAEFTQGGTTRYYGLITEESQFQEGIVYFDGNLANDFEEGFLPGSFVKFFLPSEDCSGIGCTNPIACNYNPDAVFDDGSCILLENPIIDMTSTEWILENDWGCIGEPIEFTLVYFDNQTWEANNSQTGTWSLCEDLHLLFGEDVNNNLIGTWDGTAFVGTGSNINGETWCFSLYPATQGCMDPTACNYETDAVIDDGSCLLDANANGVCDVDEVYGCTDESACNYNASATTDGTLSDSVIMNECNNEYGSNYFGISADVYFQNQNLFIPGESMIEVGGQTYLINYVNSGFAGNECNPTNVLVYIAENDAGVNLAEPLFGGETWTLTNAACANIQFCGTCGDAYTDQTIAVATSNLNENEQPTWWDDYLIVDQPTFLNTEGSFAVELVQDGNVRVYYIRAFDAETGFMYLDVNHLCAEVNAPTAVCAAHLDEDFEGGFRPGSIVRFIAPCCEDDNGNGTCDLDEGCTYLDASNYNAVALSDDGSCIFDLGSEGCPGDFDESGAIGANDLLDFLILYGNDCQ